MTNINIGSVVNVAVGRDPGLVDRFAAVVMNVEDGHALLYRFGGITVEEGEAPKGASDNTVPVACLTPTGNEVDIQALRGLEKLEAVRALQSATRNKIGLREAINFWKSL